ncbi:MAG: hypothetical protein ACYC1E_18650 [Propionibacteriaceae bacterium]
MDPRDARNLLALSDAFAVGVLGGEGIIHLLSSGIDKFHTALPSLASPFAWPERVSSSSCSSKE